MADSHQVIVICTPGHRLLGFVLPDQHLDPLLELSLNLLLLDVPALVDVPERDALLVHHLHVVVHGVGVHRHRHAQLGEVTHTLHGRAVVHYVAV